jgi:hypothetical protein
MNVIATTGPAGAGKDTVADFLVMRYGYVKMSMAGPLKAGMAAMGFPEPINRDDKEKIIPGFDFTWREAAQRLGTEWGRGLDPDIWVKAMALRCRRSTDRIVISDVRFENEAEMVRSIGGRVLHIRGRSVNLGANGAHASEAGVTVDERDGVIDNSGNFEETKKQVISCLVLTCERRLAHTYGNKP